MASYAIKVELYGNNSAGEVMPFTVSSSGAIPKGSLMVLSATPRTMAVHSALNQKFVGITNAEKDADDTSDELGVWTNGVFSLMSSGAIADGDIVVLSETANLVMASNVATDYTYIVGTALNDASAGRVPVRVLK